MLQVAVVYAGRWFGLAGQPFVDNHLRHLILPLISVAEVTVLVAVSPDQWCSAAGGDSELSLKAEVQSMFDRPHAAGSSRLRLHASLIPSPREVDPRSSGLVRAAQSAALSAGGKGGYASKFKIDQLLSYVRQFGNVARALERLRELGSHDVLLRARLDVLYSSRAEVAPLAQTLATAPAVVFAPLAYDGEYDPAYATAQWRDWNVLLAPRCAAALHDASYLGNASAPYVSPLCDLSRRCYGFFLHRGAAPAPARGSRLRLPTAPVEPHAAPHTPQDGRA